MSIVKAIQPEVFQCLEPVGRRLIVIILMAVLIVLRQLFPLIKLVLIRLVLRIKIIAQLH